MLPESLKQHIEQCLTEISGKPVLIASFEYVSGGCINAAGKIETSQGPYFLKWNHASKYPGMFEAEKKGLEILRNTKSIHVPAPLITGETGENAFIVLEWVQTGTQRPSLFQDFGVSIATMHKHSDALFGLEHNNYIGSLPQSNRQHASWIDFFIEERTEPQFKRAVDSGEIPISLHSRIEKLYSRLYEIFPLEKPALLHGDLWSGNFIADKDGDVCILDPAVYYGHREMELAFTQLFGGYSPSFYEAYHAFFPLDPGFEQRVPIYNLYPLLVHVNLFGGGYVSSVKNILKDF
jgi:protein-ribulosamine 3-kinase